MMWTMSEAARSVRLVESIWGRVAAGILMLTWLASISMTDGRAFNQLPVWIGSSLALILLLVGNFSGLKTPRLTGLSWITLALGLYFVVAALMSYSRLEALTDLGLLMAGAVFYLAGIYYGQTTTAASGMTRLLVVALVLNVLFFFLMGSGELSLNFLGRSDVGLAGAQLRNTALLMYKNFAGSFLLIGGVVLIWRALCLRLFSLEVFLQVLLALFCIGLSFHCKTRAVFLLLPLLLLMGWLLWLWHRVFNKGRITWVDVLLGMSFISVFFIAIYDFLYGHWLTETVLGIDTHLRFMIWGDLFQVLPQLPSMGYGAGASQWEIVGVFEEWSVPNSAHNEYLQAVVDYGFFGLTALLLILLLHLLRAYMLLSSDELGEQARVKLGLCAILLLSLMALALLDKLWHQHALLGMSAFICGVIASPMSGEMGILQWMGVKERSAGEAKRRPVKAERFVGRLLLIFLALSIIASSLFLSYRYANVWMMQWRYDSMARVGAPVMEKEALLTEAIEDYPDFRMVAEYSKLPLEYNLAYYQKLEILLKKAVDANPRNLFAVTMLSDVLGYQGKMQEAEYLLRESYAGDGLEAVLLDRWPTYYGINLLRWGLQKKQEGKLSEAYSMLDYALAIHRHSALYLYTQWQGARGMDMHWDKRPGIQRLLDDARINRDLLREIQIPKDDSWREPMRQGGKRSLYSRFAPDSAQRAQ